MKQYQRILVCVEEPDRDYRMLTYAGAICRAAETKEVHLLHVKPHEAPLPPGATAAAKQPEVTGDALSALASEHLKGHGTETVTCQIVTGFPLIEILRYGLDHDIDLIVIGRQPGGGMETVHEAALARRVTRKATCSVLVLPQNAEPRMDRILVPIRDSECSANAAEMACQMAVAAHGTVCCLNVFHVGSGYLSVGSTLEEHTAVLQEWAKRECEQLLDRADKSGATVQTKCVPDLYSKPVPIILKEIEREAADIIVIGARGRTGTAGVLLGAVTEHLIRSSTVPLLAVKKKGECLGILRALLTIAG